ncbi:MAG: winged helix-turn-helix transcriptional regulator, partial [Nitrospinaceae bacterium]|nr:winged helix-turn-helix transcriptional regulator [Nitrospinaceae bacterium]
YSNALRRAARAAGSMYDDALRPAGLRGTQFTLLAALSKMGEPTLGEPILGDTPMGGGTASGTPMGPLGEALALDRTTLTRNLAPLERRGLIASAPGPDRRTRIVRLTPEGAQALAQALPLWEGAQLKLAAALGFETAGRIRADLSKTLAAARAG